ncbi:MAG TPA: response regulator [Candidatus Acidoferrales bacterium]|nr:response regulator [Candidatus Acidoferrales bacterium]
MKILLVDYDAAVLRYLEKLLRKEGCEVATVLATDETCATTIREMTLSQEFDAAFIALLMPGLNSVELSGKIKMVSPHTQIILMTTPFSPAARAELLAHGVATEFFIEPPMLQELREALGTRLCGTERLAH